MDTTLNVPTGSIVVGVDGSEGARHALDWAAGLATIEKRTLVLLHAEQHPAGDTLGFGGYGGVDWVQVRADVREAALALVAAARDHVARHWPGLDVRTVTVDGDPRRALVETSAAAARLVVVGTRGLGRFAGLLLGSVSSGVAHHATSPVVVVPGPSPADGATEGGSGVVHVVADVDHDAGALLAEALQHASETARTVTVHPYHWRDAGHPADDELRRALAEAVAGWQEKHPDVPITVDAAHGPRDHYFYEHGTVPYPYLGTIPSDLVVVGRLAHRRSLFAGTIAVLEETPVCPVVVVPLGA